MSYLTLGLSLSVVVFRFTLMSVIVGLMLSRLLIAFIKLYILLQTMKRVSICLKSNIILLKPMNLDRGSNYIQKGGTAENGN